MVSILSVIYALGILLVACELGQRTGLAFVECYDLIVQFDWFLFPAEIQRMIPMILIFTQQPFEIECFGNMSCNRDTFKYVSIIGKPTSVIRSQSVLT